MARGLFYALFAFSGCVASLFATKDSLEQTSSCSETGTCVPESTGGSVLFQAKRTTAQSESAASETVEVASCLNSGPFELDNCASGKYCCYEDLKFDVDLTPCKESRNPPWTKTWGAKQRADIMLPKKTAPGNGWPALILVHGLSMTENDMHWYAHRFMKKADMVTMAITYFFGDKNHCDVMSSVKHLHDYSSDYSINTNAVSVLGYSNGGLILADILSGGTPIGKMQGFVDLLASAVFVSTIGGQHKNKVQEAVGKPVLFVHCEDDPVMPIGPAEAYAHKLLDFGDVVEMAKCVTNQGHSPAKDKEWFDSTIVNFLEMSW